MGAKLDDHDNREKNILNMNRNLNQLFFVDAR